MSETDLLPWEKRPDESGKAWNAFVIYRDMGLKRSLRGLIAREDVSTNDLKQVGQWSSKYGWVARVAAWDAEQDRQFALKMQEARVEAATRNLAVARNAITLASKRIVEMVNEDVKLSAADTTRLLDTATKLERMVLGEPTEVVQHITDSEAAAQILLDSLKRMRDEADAEPGDGEDEA